MKWETQLNVLIAVLLIVNTYLTFERIKSTERLNGTTAAIQKLLERP